VSGRPGAAGISIDLDEVVRLAVDLIAIESHSQAPGREVAVGEFLAGWFGARGVEVALVPAIGERANLVARVKLGTGKGPSVLLNGHIDTVPAGAMADAFSPRTVDGVLFVNPGFAGRTPGIAHYAVIETERDPWCAHFQKVAYCM